MRFEGTHLRHGSDVDLALRMTHNYPDRLRELWSHVAMKGYNFASFPAFRGERRCGALRDGIGRYRELLRRLGQLRRPMGIPVRRLPLSAAFFLWYCVTAAAGWRRALRGRSEPLYRF